MSRVCQGYVKGISRVYQEYVKSITNTMFKQNGIKNTKYIKW